MLGRFRDSTDCELIRQNLKDEKSKNHTMDMDSLKKWFQIDHVAGCDWFLNNDRFCRISRKRKITVS